MLDYKSAISKKRAGLPCFLCNLYMSTSEVRRRSSLSRDYTNKQKKEIDSYPHARSSSITSTYDRGFSTFENSGDATDDIEILEMARNTGSSSGSYSQLPNGNASQKRKSGALVTKWQRNGLIALAALALVVYFARGSSSSESASTSDLPAKARVPDTVKDTDGVVERPDWKEQVVGQDNKVSKVPSTNEQVDVKPVTVTSSGCKLPPGKPETQYALMIDAGSTGSRMHVYTFSNCLADDVSASEAQNALPTLKDELFYPITPGLSSYKGNPKGAAKSLEPLLEKALEAVPKSERSCTPIAVKATAGLRLLGKKESADILNEVERWLTQEWPFHVVEDGVVIMDGKDEGVYAWITINYVSWFLLAGILLIPSAAPGTCWTWQECRSIRSGHGPRRCINANCFRAQLSLGQQAFSR
jgi:hypothetical protein